MPNGFLVCKNVPIARTGVQEYLGSELGIDDAPDQLFQVYREENEVFDPAALASFEGVAFVDEHPSTDVTVNNVQILSRGFVKDVRRGEGEDSDKVIVDIIITDATTIAEIESGKREVSCGYACDYEPDTEGRIFQRNIRGNHVALVGKGRAGKTVAIKDADPQITTKPINERRVKFMSKPKTDKDANKKGLLAKFFGMVTSDADPEVVAEIAEQLVEAVAEEAAAAPPDEAALEAAKEKELAAQAPVDKKDENPDGEVLALLKALTKEVADMKATIADMQAGGKKDSDPLSELEAELGDEASGEEGVTIPVENMDEGAAGDRAGDGADAGDGSPGLDTQSSIADPAGKETGSTATADSDIRVAIANAKKTVAAIKDEKTRRTVSDAMAGLIRQTYGIKPSTPKGSYAVIQNAKRSVAQKAADSIATFDSMEERQAAYDKRNPHLNKQGGK
jgi:hypothetical protein